MSDEIKDNESIESIEIAESVIPEEENLDVTEHSEVIEENIESDESADLSIQGNEVVEGATRDVDLTAALVQSESISEIIGDEDEIVIRTRLESTEESAMQVSQQIADLHTMQEEIQGQIEDFVATREDLSQWVVKRKESFAWRLIESLRKFERELSADEKLIRDFSDNPPELDLKFGATIRRWVMRALSISSLIVFGIGFLFQTLRNNAGLISVPSPRNPATNVQVNAYDHWLSENVGISHQQIIFYLFTILLFIYIGIFYRYSRRTSYNRHVVATEALKTKTIENVIHSIKIERERLDSLHPQIPQILELLSLGLHQPWEIDSKYSSFEGEVPDASKMPESLDVSIPTEQSSQKVFSQLVFLAMNHLQKPAWRETAFNNVIQKLAESAGFGRGGLALKEIDQDQRRNGKRQMLIDLDDKQSVMLAIGDGLLAELASAVQTKILPNAQPDVISLRPDPLAELLLVDSLVHQSGQDLSSWEAKLSEIAGSSSPWAASTFSLKGQISALHEKSHVSVLIATDRVCLRAHKGVDTFKEVYSDTRPFEVAIRVDLSEWCPPEWLAIFQDYQPSEAEIAERELRERTSVRAEELTTDLDGPLAF